jgi:hypothetical protein
LGEAEAPRGIRRSRQGSPPRPATQVERGSRKIALRELDVRYVRGHGQGGGKLSDAELWTALMGPGGTRPLLREGSVVHTDSAAPYVNLGSVPASMDAAPLEHVPEGWRLETPEEAAEREMAERKAGLVCAPAVSGMSEIRGSGGRKSPGVAVSSGATIRWRRWEKRSPQRAARRFASVGSHPRAPFAVARRTPAHGGSKNTPPATRP